MCLKLRKIYFTILFLCIFFICRGTCYASNLTENNVRNFMYFVMVDGYDYDPQWTYDYLNNIDFNHYPSSNTDLVSKFLANENYNCNLFFHNNTIYITFNDIHNNGGKIVQQDNSYYNIPYFRCIGLQIKTDSSTNKTGIVSTIEELNVTGSIGTWAPARYFESNVYYFSTPSVIKEEAPVNWCAPSTYGQNSVNLYSPFIDLENLYFQFRDHTNEISLLSVDNIPYININNNNYYLGTLFDHDNTIPRWFASDLLEIYYYDGNWNNDYKLMQRTFINEDGEFINNITDSNRYLDIIYDSTEREYKYYLKSPYIYYNMLYHYRLEYLENYNQFKYIDVYWYNYNSRTIVTNGTIDNTTFDNYDSYLNQIKDLPIIQNNNENTDLIIANQNSGDNSIIDTIIDDSGVDSQIAALYTSGESASDLLDNLGLGELNLIQNPFIELIYNTFDGIIECLTYDQPVMLNFGWGGQDNWVSSEEFKTPSNVITNLVSAVLSFAFIYGLYWFYYNSIDNLKNMGLDKSGSWSSGGVPYNNYDDDRNWRLL